MEGNKFLAIAYRYGDMNGGHYIVGCWDDQQTALAFSQKEATDRGGKYGVAIYRLAGEEQEMVDYVSSGVGDEEPKFNERIYAAENIGFSVLRMIDEGEELSAEAIKDVAGKELGLGHILAKCREETRRDAMIDFPDQVAR